MLQLGEYAERFAANVCEFRDRYFLPSELLAHPDHVAVRYDDTDSFEAALRNAINITSIIVIEALPGRRVGYGFLRGELKVGTHGTAEIVEMIEPYPHEVGVVPIGGLDHVGFVVPSLVEATRKLNEAKRNEKIDVSMLKPGERGDSLSIEINRTGQKIVFIERGLREQYAMRGDIGYLQIM